MAVAAWCVRSSPKDSELAGKSGQLQCPDLALARQDATASWIGSLPNGACLCFPSSLLRPSVQSVAKMK